MHIKPLPEAKHALRTAIKELYDALHVAKDNKVREHHDFKHHEAVELEGQMRKLDETVIELRKAGVL